MANTIKIKRGLSSGLSSLTLQEGELATTTDTKKLYIGYSDGSKVEIGQKGPQGDAGPQGTRGNIWYIGDFYGGQVYEGENGDLFLNTGDTDKGMVLRFYEGTWNPVGNLIGPSGQGVPAGGATGQYLAKKSDANYDTEWITLQDFDEVSF